MGLLQKALETYECNKNLIGRIQENQAVLAPVGHMMVKADIIVTIDLEGNFQDAVKVDQEKIVIPVTEGSAGRSGQRPFERPHPLCDQLAYLITGPGDYTDEIAAEPQIKELIDRERYYVNNLRAWVESEYTHPKIAAILKYIEKNTLFSDLLRTKCIEQEKGHIKKDSKGNILSLKDFICWRVMGDSEISECWKDPSLYDSWENYLMSTKQGEEAGLCMVSGINMPLAAQHLKGVVPFHGNAKIISANDNQGFTYRGRFSEKWQASSVGFETSQKAHAALKWLVSRQGTRLGDRVIEGQSETVGGRTFLCWNPRGYEVGVKPTKPFGRKKTVSSTPTDYRQCLWEALVGYKTNLPEKEGVVLTVLDAASPGRLSVTYYNELQGSDYLDRLYDWDLHCCWMRGSFGIQAPSLKQIIESAFGIERTEKGKTILAVDEKISAQQMQRLLECRINKANIPEDIVRLLIKNVTNTHAYEESTWRKIVFVTCAVLNKKHYETRGEIAMGWTLDTEDRSFQFGRLLAAMEKVEQDYYRKTGEDRPTFALKALPEFKRRPFTTYERINAHLVNAYLNRVDPAARVRYAKLKDEIEGFISRFPKESLNRPLGETYILGYDLQHAEFYKKKEKSPVSSDDSEERVSENNSAE